MASYGHEILRFLTGGTADATPTDFNFPGVVKTGFTVSVVVEVTVGCVEPGTLTHYGMYQRRVLFTKEKSSDITIISAVQTIGTDVESDASMNVTVKGLPPAGITVLVTGRAATTLDWTVAVRVTSGGSS